MRRLPVYLLLDVSGSMMGEPIESTKNGVQVLVSTLRQDPYALETVYLCVITFDSEARRLVPLTEIAAFRAPDLVATGTTALGAALKLLADSIDSEVTKTTAEQKGDWKPIVFIMTDGVPTDDWQSGLEALRRVRPGMIVACGAGLNADTRVLRQITESVVQLDTADSSTIQAFFKWVSASVSIGSQQVDAGQQEVIGLKDLPPPPAEVNVVI